MKKGIAFYICPRVCYSFLSSCVDPDQMSQSVVTQPGLFSDKKVLIAAFVLQVQSQIARIQSLDSLLTIDITPQVCFLN